MTQPNSLEDRPWNDLEPEVKSELSLPRGMIGPEERACFHYLARNFATGAGSIVDAGAFIGASAFCFASGLSRNPRYAGRKQIIHSYDQFCVNEDYVGQFITDSLRPIASGESFLDVYKWQTGNYADLVLPHPGDLLAQKWEGGRIDILFVDISKLINLNSHVVEQFFPHLVPESSIIVQQDFFHCWHPYIHITMEYLAEYFDIVVSYVPHHSRVYRLVKAIPPEAIERLARYAFSPSERLALLDRFIEKETGKMRGMARTIKLCQLWMDGDLSGYGDERTRIEQEFDVANSHELYAGQTRELDALIARGEPCRFM